MTQAQRFYLCAATGIATFGLSTIAVGVEPANNAAPSTRSSLVYELPACPALHTGEQTLVAWSATVGPTAANKWVDLSSAFDQSSGRAIGFLPDVGLSPLVRVGSDALPMAAVGSPMTERVSKSPGSFKLVDSQAEPTAGNEPANGLQLTESSLSSETGAASWPAYGGPQLRLVSLPAGR